MNEIESYYQDPPTLTSSIKCKIKEALLISRSITLSGIFELVRFKLRITKKFSLLSSDFMTRYILNKTGLEIGGPTKVFSNKGIIPLYNLAESIDNVNYSGDTMWDNQYKEKLVTFRKTIVSEASDLSNVESCSYDFVASSNVIEHLSNPLLSLLEMKRVIRLGGLITIIVPHHDITFDHKRRVTSLNSLIEVYKLKPSEGDIRHLDLNEIFKDYDLDLDLPAGNLDSFKKRTLDNKSNRALHQTVFNTQLLLEMFNWAEIKIILVRTSLILGFILVIGTKSDNPKDEIQTSNLRFLTQDADWRNDTIFRSERNRKYKKNRPNTVKVGRIEERTRI